MDTKLPLTYHAPAFQQAVNYLCSKGCTIKLVEHNIYRVTHSINNDCMFLTEPINGVLLDPHQVIRLANVVRQQQEVAVNESQ